MTTRQQNFAVAHATSVPWSQRPLTLILSGSLLGLVLLLILAGGLLFWFSEFSATFASGRSDQSQFEVADSGLQTMKQMVGDDQVWAVSIQKEYERIFPDQPTRVQPVFNGGSFVGVGY